MLVAYIVIVMCVRIHVFSTFFFTVADELQVIFGKQALSVLGQRTTAQNIVSNRTVNKCKRYLARNFHLVIMIM